MKLIQFILDGYLDDGVVHAIRESYYNMDISYCHKINPFRNNWFPKQFYMNALTDLGTYCQECLDNLPVMDKLAVLDL